MLDLFRTLFIWIVNPCPEDELVWGEEWRNLAPGTVVALGGELDGWDIESPRLLEENAKAFVIEKVNAPRLNSHVCLSMLKLFISAFSLPSTPTGIHHYTRKNSSSSPRAG